MKFIQKIKEAMEFSRKNSELSIPVLQLEVTSRCQMQCVFCPRTCFSGRWVNGDFSLEDFENYIEPYLGKIGMVYLSGWGEPLLHPHLKQMLKKVNDAGCRCGFTTNGMLLDEDTSKFLAAEGVEVISISVAGTRQALHEKLRAGSKAEKIFRNVETLASVKQREKSTLPRVVLSYMMTRDSIHELPSFISKAAELGADDLVATNIDYPPSLEVDNIRAFYCTQNTGKINKIKSLIMETKENALKYRINFYPYPRTLGDPMPVCEAFVDGVVFVNHLGQIAPCVYLGLPVKGKIPRFFCGRQAEEIQPLNFGNVKDGLIEVVNNSNAACEFRQKMLARAESISGTDLVITEPVRMPQQMPPLPGECRSCYKIYGL